MHKEVLDFMNDFFNEKKGMILSLLLFSIISSSTESIIIPRILSTVFNSLKEKEDSHFRQALVMMVLIWIIIKLVIVLTHRIRKQLEPDITHYITIKLINLVFEKYEKENELTNVSVLVTKIHLIKRNLQELFFLLFSIFFPRIIVLLLSCYNFYLINKHLGVVVLTCITIQSFYIFSDFTECIDSSYDELEQKDELYEYIEDVLHNINMVQATFKGYEMEIKKITDFSSLTKKYEDYSFECVNKKQVKGSVINIIIFAIIILTIYILHAKKDLSMDKVTMTILSLTGLFDNLYEITYYIPELTSKLGILGNNAKFLQELMKKEEVETKVKDEFIMSSNRIEFRDVSFTYNKHYIFQSMNLILPENKIIGLSGVSGSGKSTFIRLLFGIDKPQKGEIVIDGKNVREYDMKIVRQYISYIDQNTNHLFNTTFFENLVYGYAGDKVKFKETMKKLLIDFDLYEIFQNLDKQDKQFSFFDKSVGKLGDNLSGGQKAIIHLMRLLINDKSRIIILDEVTASLDNKTRDKIVKYIQYLRNMNKTILLISHDIDVINACDIRLFFSNKGNPVLEKKEDK